MVIIVFFSCLYKKDEQGGFSGIGLAKEGEVKGAENTAAKKKAVPAHADTAVQQDGSRMKFLYSMVSISRPQHRGTAWPASTFIYLLQMEQ